MNPLLPNWLNELVAENEKLRDENQKLMEERALTQTNSLLPNWLNGVVAENEKLKEELGSALEELGSFRSTFQDVSRRQDVLDKEMEELEKLKEEKARRGYRHEHNGEVSWCKDEEMEELEHFQNIAKHLHENEQDIEEIQEERAESERELKEQHETELADLKEELTDLKEIEIGELNGELEILREQLSNLELDHFEEGDVLDYASELLGFSDYVEEHESYTDLQEEMDDMMKERDDLLEEKEELETAHEEEINSLKGNFNISTHTGNQLTILMMKAIEELKTELRESQVENVVNELVSKVCEAV